MIIGFGFPHYLSTLDFFLILEIISKINSGLTGAVLISPSKSFIFDEDYMNALLI